MQTWFRNCLVLAFFLLISFRASAQAVFDMTMSQKKISNSLYNELVILDSRTDTGSLGTVHVGMLNKLANVITHRPVAEQIKAVFNASIDSSAQNGKLLLQLRQLNFGEVINGVSEIGYCNLRANLYQINEDQYNEVGKLDTVIELRSMDVTERLYKKTEQVLTTFILSNLVSAVSVVAPWSYKDIERIDSVEKSRSTLYTSASYVDGIYSNYVSFKMQVPDYKNITLTTAKRFVKDIQANDDSGKKVKVKKAYAVVYGGKPYIYTPSGIYPLRKEANEFCFTGISNYAAKISGAGIGAASGVVGGLVGGAIGALIFNDSSNTGYFDIRIDHLNGGLIPYRKISKEELKEKIKNGEVASRRNSDNDGY